jgi:hypothetical protein
MRAALIALTLLFANLCCLTCLAQDQSPASSPTPAQPPTKGRLTPRELIELRIQMAESGYDLRKTPENFSTMVIAYEDMVSTLCMPELNESLAHAGNPSDPNCLRYLDKLLALFADDPVGVCARDGIDSPKCVELFSMQQIEAFSFYGTTDMLHSNPLELDLKLAKDEDQPQVDALRIKLDQAASAYSQDKSAANRKVYVESMYRLLGLQCRIVRTAIESRPRKDVMAQVHIGDKGKQKQGGPDPLLGYINDKLGTKKVAPTVTPTPLPDKIQVRVRYLSSDCLTSIAQQSTTEPSFAAPICNRDGFIAPVCVKARRTERKLTLAPNVQSHPDAGQNGGIVQF